MSRDTGTPTCSSGQSSGLFAPHRDPDAGGLFRRPSRHNVAERTDYRLSFVVSLSDLDAPPTSNIPFRLCTAQTTTMSTWIHGLPLWLMALFTFGAIFLASAAIHFVTGRLAASRHGRS